MSGPAFIEYRDVQVEYTGHVEGLRGISLQVEKGEFVFFVGGSGAGKSTLIKTLTREVRHTSGSLRIGEQDLSRVSSWTVHKLRREMGVVPQDFALLPRKNVYENVAYAMRAIGHTRREVRKRVPEILEQVGLMHRAKHLPAQLSGGEQQRVAIARALIHNPPLLLADEPTGNLDPETSLEIMELLRALNANGATVIVATHDMPIVEKMGKRVVKLDSGLVASDTPAPEVIDHV